MWAGAALCLAAWPCRAEPLTLRVWELPLKESRDIGSRLTSKSSTFTTHKIDPDVDETRASLIQDFLYSQSLTAFTYAPGVGEVSVDEHLQGDFQDS